MCILPRQTREAVVVVDPYSSGVYIIDSLRKAGAFIIVVQSTLQLEDEFLSQFKPEQYDASISHENIEDTLLFIESLSVSVRGVLPGSEFGVVLAEELQSRIGVSSNAGTTDVRRHKHAMHQRLRETGVRGILEICTGDVDAALRWISGNTSFPVIVKPPMSGGSDGLHFCHSEDDVREAFLLECKKYNITGVMNTELLVQEFLDGPEYVVDCVSFEGKHFVTGLWKYKKDRNAITKAITYEYSEFLEPEGRLQETLIQYTIGALDALGIRFGASHSEVIIDRKGPCLIETGARMHGGMGPKGIALATGVAPYDLLVDITLHEAQEFQKLYERRARYALQSYLLCVDLRNFKGEGHLANSIEDALLSFTTIQEAKVANLGEFLPLTRDLVSSPGSLLMTHPNKEVMFQELEQLRALEDSTLYEML